MFGWIQNQREWASATLTCHSHTNIHKHMLLFSRVSGSAWLLFVQSWVSVVELKSTKTGVCNVNAASA